MNSKSVSQIFKILFQAGDINVFVLCGVLFSTYVQLKSYFSDVKKLSGEILDKTLVEKISKINVAKY